MHKNVNIFFRCIFAVGDHVERVNTEAMCKIPHKKVEYMKSSPNKSYRPKWTILYRCGNDTACCSESHTCGMKNQVQLILPFKVVSN